MIVVRARCLLVCLSVASGLLSLGVEAAQKRKQTPAVPMGSLYNLTEWLGRPLELGNMVGMFITSEKNEPLLEVAERLLHESQFKSASNSLAIGALTDDAGRYFFRQLPDFYAAPKSPLLQRALDAIEAELQRSLEDAVNAEQAAGRLAVMSMYEWIAKTLPRFRLLDVAVSVLRAFANGLRRPDGVGAACFNDSVHLANGLFSARTWALNMIDAWGKPAPGILAGNLKWEGAHDQCTQVAVPHESLELGRDARSTTKGFMGNYCDINFDVPNGLVFMLQNSETTGPLLYGACMPSTCSGDDVRNLLESLSIFGMKLPTISTSRCERDVKPESELRDDDNGYCSRSTMSAEADTSC